MLMASSLQLLVPHLVCVTRLLDVPGVNGAKFGQLHTLLLGLLAIPWQQGACSKTSVQLIRTVGMSQLQRSLEV